MTQQEEVAVQLMEVVGMLLQFRWSLERGESLFMDKGAPSETHPSARYPPIVAKAPRAPITPSTVTIASAGSVSPEVFPQTLPASSAASRAFEQRVLSAASCRGSEEFLLHLPNSTGIPPCQLSSSPGAVDTAWLLCIFFRLSRSEELAGAGAVEAGIGPGEVTANTSGLDTGIITAVVLGTASVGKWQDLRTHNWL